MSFAKKGEGGSILTFIDKIIIRLNTVIMIVALAVMIALGFIQVVLRNFFDYGFPWADIVIRNLVLWVGFSGAVVATSKGRHIAIGALLRFVPDAGKRLVHVVTSLSSSVICFFLACASIRFVTFEKEAGGFLTGAIPLWLSEIIMPMTFCFMTYLFLVHAFSAPDFKNGELP